MDSRKSLEQYIIDSTKNIEEDRSITTKLLQDLIVTMDKHKEEKYTHKNFGEIAAMYLETLQRSNEQLVKIAALVQRSDGTKEGLSRNEKDNLFDLIKEG